MMPRLAALALLPLTLALAACDIETVDTGGGKPNTGVDRPYDLRDARADLEQATRGFVRKIDLSETRSQDGIEHTVRRSPDGPLMLKVRLAVLEPEGRTGNGSSAGVIWRGHDAEPDFALRLAAGGNLVLQHGTGDGRTYQKAQDVAPNNREVLLTVIECGNELQVYKGEKLLFAEAFGRRPLEDRLKGGRVGLFLQPDAHARFNGFTLKKRPGTKVLPKACQSAINRTKGRRN